MRPINITKRSLILHDVKAAQTCGFKEAIHTLPPGASIAQVATIMRICDKYKIQVSYILPTDHTILKLSWGDNEAN